MGNIWIKYRENGWCGRWREMLAVHAWIRLRCVHKPWLMRAIRGQCQLSNDTLRLMQAAHYVQAKGDTGRPILTYRWVICKVHVDVADPCLTLAEHCASPIWPGRYCMPLADVACSENIGLGWCCLSLSDVCHPADGLTLRLMHVGLH